MNIPWSSFFEFGVSPWALVVRGTIVYWFIFFLLRMAGRRDFGSVGTGNILLLVLIADAAQNAMAGEYKTIAEGMVLIGTLVFWSVFIDRLCYYFPPARVLLEPVRICLVKDGVLQRRGMRREYISKEELMAELRKKGVGRLEEVHRAFIEEAGDISVLRHQDK